MMRSGQDILGVLHAHKAILRARFSVQRIGLFGSSARGVARSDSDIDMLVELGEPTFDHYMDLKFYLEDLLCVWVSKRSSPGKALDHSRRWAAPRQGSCPFDAGVPGRARDPR